MKYESTILKRLIDTYGVVGNPRYISEIIKEFIVRGKERFPELFTYQADWLAHIDEFGLNPSYTVSYTGQSIYAPNTLERPVKRAILSGQTLVNLVPKKIIDYTGSSDWDGFHALVQNSTKPNEHWRTLQDLKPNTKYYVSCYVETFEDVDTKHYHFNNPNDNCVFADYMKVNGVGHYQWISRTKRELTDETYIALRCQNAYARGRIKIRDIMIIEYQEGMENWDIPYFEGMQSVKMPVLKSVGKNLFDYSSHPITLEKLAYADGQQVYWTGYIGVKTYVPVKENTTYTYSNDINVGIRFGLVFYDDDKSVLSYINNFKTNSFTSFTTPKGCKFIRFAMETQTIPQWIQLEQDSTPTSYEPYKSNILTVNEEVELRGIGDVKDELNVATGELTQRVGEATFKGALNEGWGQFDNSAIQEQTCLFAYYGGLPSFPSENLQMICDKFTISKDGYSALLNTDKEMIHVYADKAVYFRVLKSKLSTQDAAGFKRWLSQNPFTIQYQLKTESIKTVDLTILDQNGQNVKQLMSFNGGTHFNTRSSEGSPLPTVSISVETDLEETLKMCSLEGNTM